MNERQKEMKEKIKTTSELLACRSIDLTFMSVVQECYKFMEAREVTLKTNHPLYSIAELTVYYFNKSMDDVFERIKKPVEVNYPVIDGVSVICNKYNYPYLEDGDRPFITPLKGGSRIYNAHPHIHEIIKRGGIFRLGINWGDVEEIDIDEKYEKHIISHSLNGGVHLDGITMKSDNPFLSSNIFVSSYNNILYQIVLANFCLNVVFNEEILPMTKFGKGDRLKDYWFDSMRCCIATSMMLKQSVGTIPLGVYVDDMNDNKLYTKISMQVIEKYNNNYKTIDDIDTIFSYDVIPTIVSFKK